MNSNNTDTQEIHRCVNELVCGSLETDTDRNKQEQSK